METVIKYVVEDKISNDAQLEAALGYIKTVGESEMNITEFEKSCGVGVIVTEDDIKNTIKAIFEEQKATIVKERYKFNFGPLIYAAKDKLKWGDGKKIMEEIDKVKLEYLGPPTKEDEEKKEKKASKEPEPHPGKKSTDFGEYKKERLSKIVARDLTSALNSKALLEERAKKYGYSVMTRFPPEPNGILHIGHAKAMRYNFTLAEDYNGACYLRYDDTNPEKENITFMKNIQECVKWLGYKPWKITWASDYFQQLYDYAVVLIKKGKAYVCHQTKQQIAEGRTKCIPSPWRDRPIEENLKYFEWMKQGRFSEKEAMLRLKIDMKHDNPCMRDPVAYRIKYVPHPHAGDAWCIYPMYDFTHCISDNIEGITHSCCSLEFEIRRDLYYWILEALDIYRPFVWEFSRLNISNSVMSKRLLQSLIDDKLIKDWDDPRLYTLLGLRRRGVRPEAINEFCDLIGVTRRGNEMMLSDNLLENCIRKDLDPIAPRTMTVLDPLLVILTNVPDDFEQKIEVNLFPKDPDKGKQVYYLTKKIFIEKTDYQSEAPASYYGLTRTQLVLLKYATWIKVEKEIKNEKGEIISIEASIVKDCKEKIQGVIHWTSDKYSMPAEVRYYNKLFTEEDPKTLGAKWKDCINKNSLVVYDRARIWKNITNVNHLDRFQFERKGFFAVDYDSDTSKNRFVFNLIVNLSEGKDKKDKKDMKKKEKTDK